jgi:nicotinate-nucleotide pyrophosphorylase (carboxylating)
MSPLQPAEREAALQLIEWSLREDLAGQVDVTSTVLIAEREWARVDVVVRAAGVLAGGVLLPLVMNRFDPRIEVAVLVADGSPVRPGTRVAELRGPLRSLLTAERTALNFLLHLSGVASLTARYVAEVQGTRARVFDTRKTLPGWRLLDKYAVRAGGGRNHRMGLFDMLLVKDNHVAGWLAADPSHTLAGVVSLCRQKAPGVPLEIEVDTLAQLAEVLPVQPDMVLLDNMSVAQLREGVALRDQLAPGVELEASGGVNLQTIGAIAQTGVERISVGALTHSAPALDLAFDWGGAERQPREQQTANR